jgi:hypothetical protein
MTNAEQPIDYQAVEKLAMLHCTDAEIAAFLGMGEAELVERMNVDGLLFKAVDGGRSLGRMGLRRLQWRAAEAGRTTMLIWLGKQLLGQRERPEDSDNSDELLSKLVAAIEEGARASIQSKTGRRAPKRKRKVEPSGGGDLQRKDLCDIRPPGKTNAAPAAGEFPFNRKD